MSGSVDGTVAVSEVIGPNGGLDPERGVLLAKQVIGRTTGGAASIVLDFSRAGAMSSGFANAFFLRLQTERPLEEWRSRITFLGLDSLQSRILRSSRAAAEGFSSLNQH